MCSFPNTLSCHFPKNLVHGAARGGLQTRRHCYASCTGERTGIKEGRREFESTEELKDRTEYSKQRLKKCKWSTEGFTSTCSIWQGTLMSYVGVQEGNLSHFFSL